MRIRTFQALALAMALAPTPCPAPLHNPTRTLRTKTFESPPQKVVRRPALALQGLTPPSQAVLDSEISVRVI